MRTKIMSLLAAALLTLAGSGAVLAESPSPSATPQATIAASTTAATTKDDGFPIGLIGLLGLAGLAGLMRRDRPAAQVVTREERTPAR